jgi:predicted transcriptional regulator
MKVSEKQLGEMKKKLETLLGLLKAPSQFMVFLQLLNTGKTMTVKEISDELVLTQKATERAVAKLIDKDVIQKSTFRDGGYNVDTRGVTTMLLIAIIELYQGHKEKVG